MDTLRRTIIDNLIRTRHLFNFVIKIYYYINIGFSSIVIVMMDTHTYLLPQISIFLEPFLRNLTGLCKGICIEQVPAPMV